MLEGELARKGKKPKQDGEAWMWRSGQVGVWPLINELGGNDLGDYTLDHREEMGNEWREEETGALVDALEGIAE